jgi:protein-export membrane protein SecD
MPGLTPFFSRLRAAGAALMPSVAVALGLMGVSTAAADDGTARGSSSRTGTVFRSRIDVAQVRNRWLQSIQTDARRVLKEEEIGHSGAVIAGNQVCVTLRDAGQVDRAVQRLRTLATPSTSWLFRTSYSFTVKSGENGLIVIEPSPAGLRSREESTLSQSIEVVRRRVAPDGSAGASVTAGGKDGIPVQFAGLDISGVKPGIATPAKLTFQLVDGSIPAGEAQAEGVPPGDEPLPDKKASVTSGDLQDAAAPAGTVMQGPSILFGLKARGAAAFARITRENTGKRLAIVLDGKVLPAPIIHTEIPGGSSVIAGNFTVAEASRMALLARTGALPAPLLLAGERTIELTGRRRE